MTKDGGQGSEVMGAAELEPLLHLAKRKSVSCAISVTKDKQGVILLHRLATLDDVDAEARLTLVARTSVNYRHDACRGPLV